MVTMNLLILTLTLTLYLKLLITRVSTLPLAASRVTKTFSTNEDSFLRRVIRRQKRLSVTYPAFLYTRHTGKFVKITQKEINALTTKDDKYAEILLTTHGIRGEHSIQGKHSKKFVCMNKGRVVLKKTFKKQDCMFYMRIHEKGYVTFRLVHNEKWFLGFKKSGNIKLAHKTEYDHKAAWMMIERPPRKS